MQDTETFPSGVCEHIQTAIIRSRKDGGGAKQDSSSPLSHTGGPLLLFFRILACDGLRTHTLDIRVQNYG